MAMYEVWCSHCNAPHDSSSMKGKDISKNVTPGTSVWIPGSGRQKWILASVLSRCGSVVTVQLQDEYQRLRVIDLNEHSHSPICLPANAELAKDMTELHFTHEPAILHNLKSRAEDKIPYTFIGSVLVSINPLRNIPEPPDFENHPHPKTVAERAFLKMEFARSQLLRLRGQKKKSLVEDSFGKMNQSILISGESGSGKTEAAKRVLMHLVDREEYEEEILDARPELYDFQDKLIGSDPILESFGNAMTKRNPNSSRFGKFLKLFYDMEDEYPDELILCGASITTYLLERSRVTYQEEGERNFRVFYQMLIAPSNAFHSQLGLIQADYTFRYLGNQKVNPIEMDKNGYIELRTSLHMAQFRVKTSEIFKVVAAVLHIGNIDFEEEVTHEGSVVRVKEGCKNVTESTVEKNDGEEEYSPISFVTDLLGIDKDALTEILCQRIVDVGGEKIVKRHDLQTAMRTREAVAKHVYKLLFDWIVQELNTNLQVAEYDEQDDNVSFIGVLDVFGFEQFDVNGFEQLCINYANEVLLSLFTKEILIGESDIYKSEGLVLQEGDLPSVMGSLKQENSCIQLFEGSLSKERKISPGIFTLLDNQAKVPSPSEEKFLIDMQKNFKGNETFVLPHPSERKTKFIIRHYADDVPYSVGSFLEKNDDSLPVEIENLFRRSSHIIVSDFSSLISLKKKAGKKRKSVKNNSTVTGAFTQQMHSLRDTLTNTGCSYIRCIKPNTKLYINLQEPAPVPAMAAKLKKKKSKNVKIKKTNSLAFKVQKKDELRYFDEAFVSHQLRNLGVFDAVNVLRSGLPTRVPYPSITKSFSDIIRMDSIPFFRNKGDKFKDRFFVSALMWAFQVPRSSYRLGHTRIFFKSGQLDIVKEILKAAAMWEHLPNSRERAKILSRFRYFYARSLWRKAVVKIIAQNHFLRWLKRRRSAIAIQSLYRGHLVRMAVHERILQETRRKQAAVIIQSTWRVCMAKKKMEELREVKMKQELERLNLALQMEREKEQEYEVVAEDEDEDEDDQLDLDEEDDDGSISDGSVVYDNSEISKNLESFFYEINKRSSRDREERGSLFSSQRIRNMSEEEWFNLDTQFSLLDDIEEEETKEINVPLSFKGEDYMDQINLEELDDDDDDEDLPPPPEDVRSSIQRGISVRRQRSSRKERVSTRQHGSSSRKERVSTRQHGSARLGRNSKSRMSKMRNRASIMRGSDKDDGKRKSPGRVFSKASKGIKEFTKTFGRKSKNRKSKKKR